MRILTKDFLINHKNNLNKTIEAYKNIQSKATNIINDNKINEDIKEKISELEKEIESIDKLLEVPEETYDGLYYTEAEDIIRLAEDLSAKDKILQNELTGIDEVLTNSLKATNNDLAVLEDIIDLSDNDYEIKEDMDKEIDIKELEKKGFENISKHPIKFVLKSSEKEISAGIKQIIEGINNSISIACSSRKVVIDKENEYQTAKSQAVEAVKKMGSENYSLIQPTRLNVLDTIRNKIDDISNSYTQLTINVMKYTSKFLNDKTYYMGIKDLISLGSISYLKENSACYKDFDEHIKKYDTKIKNTNSELLKEYYETAKEQLISNQNYIKSGELEKRAWNCIGGICPITRFLNIKNKITFKTKEIYDYISNLDKETIKDKFLELCENSANKMIDIFNRGIDLISNTLTKDINTVDSYERNLQLKKIAYDKAASDIGKIQTQLESSLNTFKNNNSDKIEDAEINKNKELLSQIKAIDAVGTQKKVLDNLSENLEKQIKNKEKVLEKANKKNNKKFNKEKHKEIKSLNKDLKTTKKEQSKVEKEINKLKKMQDKEQKINAIKNKLAYNISEFKMDNITIDELRDVSDNDITIKNKIMNAVYNRTEIDDCNECIIKTDNENYVIDTVNRTIKINDDEAIEFKSLAFNENNKMVVTYDEDKYIVSSEINDILTEKQKDIIF